MLTHIMCYHHCAYFIYCMLSIPISVETIPCGVCVTPLVNQRSTVVIQILLNKNGDKNYTSSY